MLVSVAEHHSNLVPWQLVCQATGATLKHVPLTKDGRELDMQVHFFLTSIHVVPSEIFLCWTGNASFGIVITASSLMLNVQAFADLLSPKTKLVGLVHVSNMLGSILDTDYVVEQAHKVSIFQALFMFSTQSTTQLSELSA